MEKYIEIKHEILRVMQEFGYKNYDKVAVEIYGKLTYLTESEIRALQIIAKRKAAESDEAYQEFCKNIIVYNGPHKGRKKDKSNRIMHFGKDGYFDNSFEGGFMDLCGKMSRELL